jgi:hypothetical protein
MSPYGVKSYRSRRVREAYLPCPSYSWSGWIWIKRLLVRLQAGQPDVA